jgi:hypothetical protein
MEYSYISHHTKVGLIKDTRELIKINQLRSHRSYHSFVPLRNYYEEVQALAIHYGGVDDA